MERDPHYCPVQSARLERALADLKHALYNQGPQILPNRNWRQRIDDQKLTDLFLDEEGCLKADMT